MIKVKKISFLEIFICAMLVLPLTSEMSYTLYAILIIFTILLYWNKLRIKIKGAPILPFLIFLIWMYGLFLGFINGNRIEYVLQNFAGMTMYLVFYIIYIYNYDYRKLMNIIYKSSIFSVFFTLSMWLLKFNYSTALIDKIFLINNYNTGGKNILYSSQMLIFVAYGICLYNILCGKSKNILFHIIVIIFATVDIVLCINLSGYLLAFIMANIVVILSFIFTKIKFNRINIILILILTIILLIFILVSYYNNGIFYSIFDMSDKGNKIRLDQISLALSESSLFGKGLGATFSSFIRSEEAYGMEVVYVNLIHKFGVFSIILFYSYLKIIIISIKNIINKKNIEKHLFFMLAISFIYPSLSNPFLYGAVPVVLHTCMYYCIDKSNENASECSE